MTFCLFVVARNNTRYDAVGSVVKLNHHSAPLQVAPQSGYRELVIPTSVSKSPFS